MSAKSSWGRSKQVALPVARLSYPHLVEPKAFESNSTPKYGAELIFPPNETGAVQQLLGAICQEAASKVWDTFPPNGRNPICSGANRPGKPEYEGRVYINAKAKETRRPILIGPNKESIDPSAFYGGCYVRAVVHAFAYTKPTPGVTFELKVVQFVKDGEPLGGDVEEDGVNGIDLLTELNDGSNNPANYATQPAFGAPQPAVQPAPQPAVQPAPQSAFGAPQAATQAPADPFGSPDEGRPF